MHRLTLCLILFLAVPVARGQLLHDLTDRTVTLDAPVRTVAGKRAEVTWAGPRLAAAFNGVVAQGTTTDAALEGWIRFEAGGTWGTWLPLTFVHSATGGTFIAGHRGPVWHTDARFELRFSLAEDAPLRITDVGVFDNRRDTDATAAALPPVVPRAGKKTGHIVPPPLITRAEWGAGPFVLGAPVPLARPSYNYMTFHHAAGYSATTVEEGKRQVKAIQDLHQDIRGWSDIGYQFVIDRGGHLYQGRPFMDGSTSLDEVPVLAMGAHVGGNNTGNIGVSLLGCYHPPEGAFCEQEITPEAWETYTVLFAFLSERYGVAPELIRGHRDFSATACPGENNYERLPAFRTAVAEVLITGNAALGAAAFVAAEADADGVVRLSVDLLEDNGIEGYRLERTLGGVTTVVTRGTGIPPTTFTDSGVSAPGLVLYSLVAEGANGRTQTLADIEVVVEAPDGYALTDNYPNPFAAQTTIRYFLDQDGVVDLRVYDAAGREVAALVNAHQSKDRWYFQSFDASGLASGLYYYRLRVTGFTEVDYDETRSLVVLR